jgi:CheY-like chemotaxis protein
LPYPGSIRHVTRRLDQNLARLRRTNPEPRFSFVPFVRDAPESQRYEQGLANGSHFEMPLAPTPAEQVAAPPDVERASAPASGAGARVLVVDDNRDAVDLLAEVISSLGYQVRVAYDGAAAVDEVLQFRPDVVLLDIGLPILDGYEVARRVRQTPEGADVKLVAVTGYGQEGDKSRADAAGFDRHLVKPIDLDKLFETLRSMAAPSGATPGA